MLDWYQTVFEVIDMRSFSNLWYWIALAVVWSTTSHYVLGVPYDMITRARRSVQSASDAAQKVAAGEADQSEAAERLAQEAQEAEGDLYDIVRVNVNRILYIVSAAGLWIVAIAFFILTALALMAFYYWLEFAQAVFFLALPMGLVFALSIWTARGIRRADGADLYVRLHRHRVMTQVIGMISIFVTAFWGMWQNLSIGAI